MGKFFLFLMIFGISLLASCSNNYSKAQNPETELAISPETELAISNCAKMPNSSETYECIRAIAIDKLQHSICNNINDDAERNYCLNRVARTKKDDSICNKIKPIAHVDIDERNICKNVVLLEKAKDDPSICEGLPEREEGNCYHYVAFDKKNFSFCDKIKKPYWGKDSCYRAIFMAQNYSCDSIEPQEIKDLCYYTLVDLGYVYNATLCQKIKNSKHKDSCYYAVGVRKFDRFSCGKIEDINVRDECLGRIRGEVFVCDMFKNDDKRRSCYREIAYVTSDSSFCENIEDSHRDDCYYLVGTDSLNYSVCEKIKEKLNKFFCLRHTAIHTKNALICDKIYEQINKDDCYFDVAFYAKKFEACNMIGSEDKKAVCYQYVAINSKDVSFCNKIEINSIRSDCLKDIAIITNDPTACDNVDYEHKASCYFSIGTNSQNYSLCDKIHEQDYKDLCYQGYRSK